MRRCTLVGVIAAAGFGCAVAGAEVLKKLLATAAAPEYPCVDLPFFVLTGLIIAGAVSLTAWFGWQLRAVDWPADRIVQAQNPKLAAEEIEIVSIPTFGLSTINAVDA